MDAEVRLGRRLDAGGKVAVVGGVEVERQQLVFGVRPLQTPRQPRLAQFAAQRALGPLLRRQVEVARQLLGQRAGAGDRLAVAPALPDGAGDAEQIDAGVRVEAAVFGGDRRIAAGERDFAQRDRHLFAAVGINRLVEGAAVRSVIRMLAARVSPASRWGTGSAGECDANRPRTRRQAAPRPAG